MDKVLVRKNTISQIVKGCLVALSVSVIGILVFAVVLRFLSLNDLTIKIVNQIIKVLSVLLGVMISLKKDKTKGLIKGSIVGIIYTLSSYLLFSILVATFSFGLSIIYDMIFSGVVGLVSGVMFVNSKK